MIIVILIGDRHNLNKLCDELVNMNITIEDILDEHCDLVDSTTETSVVTSSPVISAAISDPPTKKAKMMASVAAGGQALTDAPGSSSSITIASGTSHPAKKKKAKAKDKNPAERSHTTTDGGKNKAQKKQNALAKVAAAKERANKMFSAIPPRPRLPSISSDDDELADSDHEISGTKQLPKESSQSAGLLGQIESQRLLIKSLKQKLKSGQKCKCH